MGESSKGDWEEMEEITSVVKPSNRSLSGKNLTMSFDEDDFHMDIAIGLIENDDLLVENQFEDAVNEIDGLVVYRCNMCEKICKSIGGLIKHKNSKHVEVGASSTEGRNAPLDKDSMNSIVNTIKQNLIEEKLYGEEIESSVQKVTATEALLKETEPLYSRFCKNKNQDKLLQVFYGLMPKSTTLLNFVDYRITNLVMIHIPDHLVSFYNIRRRSNTAVATTVDSTDC